MISVFLPVEDYCLNYESKVENSFVNAIAPQKKFVPPPTKSPDCSCSHPRRSPRKASAYLPASPPSYPEESSQSLHAKKRISPPPHFYPRQKKTPLYAPASEPANTLAKQSPPPLPLTKELIHLLQRPTPKPHKFPSLWSTPKRIKRAKKTPVSLPADKCPFSLSASSPFMSLFKALLQHPQKQPYGRSSKKPTVGRLCDPR